MKQTKKIYKANEQDNPESLTLDEWFEETSKLKSEWQEMDDPLYEYESRERQDD